MRHVIALLLLFTPIAVSAQVEVSKLCTGSTSDTYCPPIQNDLNGVLIKTSSSSGTVQITGTIQTKPPAVANSMVFKAADGTIQTASSTTISNAGTASESLITANVNVLNNLNVLGGLKLNSPTTLATCNATTSGTIVMSGAKLCACDGTSYKNILGGVNIITGLLTGTCP